MPGAPHDQQVQQEADQRGLAQTLTLAHCPVITAHITFCSP
uniref:Uncharacterized protein n=1 Tax=Anguilla anguilla TaxID=7936 RepID=A0A0E9P7D2_ANGAN